MTIRNVSETKAELSSLLVKVEAGEEVIITRNGRPIARLARLEVDQSPRELGAMKGEIRIADDFDEPCPEIEQLFMGAGVEPAA